MTRASSWCVVIATIAGCESGEEPVRGVHPGLEPVRYEQPTSEPREPVEGTPRPEQFEEAHEPEDENEDTAKRDLSTELNRAIGVPIDCVQDFTAPRPTKIRVSVTATVRPTGMVISPTVYGSGLSAAARRCIERRAETVVLEALDETESERVSTVLEIDYTPEIIVESDPGVPEPRLRNVLEPLPKRPEIPPSGQPIQEPSSRPITGGFEGGRPPQGPEPRPIEGPKPRPIDGYDVDQNAKRWR